MDRSAFGTADLHGEESLIFGDMVELGGDVSAVEQPTAGEVAEAIDVGAHMAAQRDGIGGRTVAGRRVHIAMLFGHRKQVRGMRRVVRHPHEIRLRQIIDTGIAGQVEQFHDASVSAPRLVSHGQSHRAKSDL